MAKFDYTEGDFNELMAGDIIIEDPMKFEVNPENKMAMHEYDFQLIFFKSGKVLFFESHSYEGGQLYLYSSVDEFIADKVETWRSSHPGSHEYIRRLA